MMKCKPLMSNLICDKIGFKVHSLCSRFLTFFFVMYALTQFLVILFTFNISDAF